MIMGLLCYLFSSDLRAVKLVLENVYNSHLQDWAILKIRILNNPICEP